MIMVLIYSTNYSSCFIINNYDQSLYWLNIPVIYYIYHVFIMVKCMHSEPANCISQIKIV